jgi:hypothetical protein
MTTLPTEISHEEFGGNFLRMALPPERVCEAINRVLGERLELGPMGAGPGRMLAKITAVALFGPTRAETIEGDEIAFRVWVPAAVTVDLDLAVDKLHFTADVLVPVIVRVTIDSHFTLLWTVTPPEPDEVTLDISTETKRAALLLKVANLDDELRAFVIRVAEKELQKPHIVRATRIDLRELVDAVWPHVADRVLPDGPDRAAGAHAIHARKTYL